MSELLSSSSDRRRDLLRYINLRLAALGQPTSESTAEPYFLQIFQPLFRNTHQKSILLGNVLPPVDARIQAFLDEYLGDVCPQGVPRLPSRTFTLDLPGMARTVSLPADGDTFSSPYLRSYRIAQGVLHNPKSDRRTTQGIFHIVEDGLPVPSDKLAVPRRTFAKLLALALQQPEDALTLPFTANQEKPARLIVSSLLRPLVCPATGRDPEKTMEIRFFAPASLVSNLDFVESIFGNAGDPYLPENDAALDVEHWTGHTGCVILAPHIVGLKKKDLLLPHYDQATERQRNDGMCWRDENEIYNDGNAFKIAARDERGVMVTVIADNYFGYCKKEVKTQISYAANLYGNAEEEHAGGAIAFPSYVLGLDFLAGRTVLLKEASFADSMGLLGDGVDVRPEGYAIDRRFPTIHYIAYGAEFNVDGGYVRWSNNGETHQIPLRAENEYVLPAGYRVRMEKQPGGTRWRLVGIRPDGTLCHKPCTVSGAGKSEISKSIAGAIVKGPIFVQDYFKDTEAVAEILKMDTASIYRNPQPGDRAKRPILSPDRSLGSVIKLLTPSPDYTDDYNEWLRKLPQTVRQYVCLIKRYYRPEWGDSWREEITVDRIDGQLGHELKLHNQKLIGNYLRVGFETDGSWRVFKLRPDFSPAAKVQVEDDITASVTVPRETLNGLDPRYPNPSVKVLKNCEAKLFQRPDDAIHRGFDEQAEADLASPDTFISNFEPLSQADVQKLLDRVVDFDEYTDPMKRLLRGFVENGSPEWAVSSAHPRVVDGKPSKNPRYLQIRPDLANARDSYLAQIAARLYRGIPANEPLHFPVNAVLSGRRGSPPEPAISLPPLAVYNPIHYQELPELFMDYICSLTGKSPSTTGFGSEGALTKRPFNALPPIIDMNNALVSAMLTGYAGFSTAAAWVGPYYRVDHDISMLVPEIWCRMNIQERDPASLIDNGYLEKVEDFNHNGKRVLASRLGYRITARFAGHYLGRIFETPNIVFTEAFLRPETQDLDQYVAGINAIVEAQSRVAREYFDDGSVEAACPQLKALLHIMANGHYEGKTADDPAIRAMFTREALLTSDWYRERLRTKQERDRRLWERHVRSLEKSTDAIVTPSRLAQARAQLARVSARTYLDELFGTIGADPRLGR